MTPPKKYNKSVPAAGGGTASASSVETHKGQQQHFESHVFESNLLPPDMLAAFEELVPGTAAQLIADAREEAIRRREREEKILVANIASQERNFTITEQRDAVVARSDLFGQIAGLIVCLTCIASAVSLVLVHPEHWKVAATLAALPTAAMIKSFRLDRFSVQKKTPNE